MPSQVLSTSSEIEVLLARCLRGNEVILELWRRACLVVDDNIAWAQAMELYHQATVKLSGLCMRLEVLGYDRCLYDVPRCRGTKDIVCFACPSKYPYWRPAPEQGEML